MVRLTVMSSLAVTIWSTLSGVQPNWLKMKDGVLPSLITRASENTTSAAVKGLPEWKVWPGRQVEDDGVAVVGDVPALGDPAGERHQDRLVGRDAVVDVGDLAADQLEGLGRIERDDVVDVHRDHQRGRWGLGPGERPVATVAARTRAPASLFMVVPP